MKSLLFIVIGLVVLLMPKTASPAPIILDDISLNYQRFLPGARHPLFPSGMEPKEELNLDFNTTILTYFYWNNRVHSMTNQHQFHVIGWNYRLGVRATPWLSLQYEHFSRHLLDTNYAGYPIQDSVGAIIKLYGDGRTKDTLWQ